MNAMLIISAVIAGLGSGVVLAWFFSHGARKSAYDRGISDVGKELAIARERLSARDCEIAAASQRAAALDQSLVECRASIAVISSEKSASEATIAQMKEFAADLRQRLTVCEAEKSRLLALETELKQSLAQKDESIAQERKTGEEKLKVLIEAKEQLKAEFQNLAGQILEEKSARFTAQNKDNIDFVLKPLREQLADFRKKVEDVYINESKDRASLSAEINILKQLNQRISEDAINLTNALKGDNKAAGDWGQLALERVLEMSGLEKGREYEIQVHTHDEEGNRFLPDVIVRLPEKRDIVIDSKISLKSYELYCTARNDEDKNGAMRAHLASLRQHINGLSVKKYQDLKEVRTLDFVFMFIPIEAAFLAAIREDDNLFREAFERNIILVCPSTLLVTMRTIANIWRYERQNQNAMKIAAKAGALHEKFVTFVTTLEEVGKALRAASTSYERAYGQLSTGKGNLVRRAEEFKILGVKTNKNLSQALLENAHQEEELPEIENTSGEATSS